MTNREFLNAIIESNINEELTVFAQTQIEKLDTKNEKRKTSFSPKQKENEELKNQILEILKEESKFASDIGIMLDISTSKASALCTQLINDNKISCVDQKNSKKNKAKFYSLIEE